jgi:2-hydroxy-4-carboxymuconate semialdehyde hemiacetal dehydrogenase
VTTGKPARKLGVALLGHGSIGVAHINAFRAVDGDGVLFFRTVMGRLPESTAAFAAEHGFGRSTTRLDETLDDPEVDVVIVASPSEAHAEQTERALLAGKDVLCEIPLATSLAAVDRLIDLADQSGRRLMVCHTERYFPALIEVRRQIATGALHPSAVVSRFMFQRRANVNWMGRQRSWTDNLLWHHGCHSVDAALWLLGATEVEVAAQIALPSGNLHVPMDLGIVMRTPRDEVVTVALSYNTHLPLHDYLIIGQENTFLFDNGELRDKSGVVQPSHGQDNTAEAIGRQNAEFLAAVLEQREPAVSARAVRPAMAALQAAQDSLTALQQRTSLGAAGQPAVP